MAQGNDLVVLWAPYTLLGPRDHAAAFQHRACMQGNSTGPQEVTEHTASQLIIHGDIRVVLHVGQRWWSSDTTGCSALLCLNHLIYSRLVPNDLNA